MFETCMYSSAGGRSVNEDYAIFSTDRADRCVWVLADGLGGHDKGEVASRLASETFLKAALTVESVDEPALIGLMGQTNSRIRLEQQSAAELAGMRTTLVAALSDREAIWSCHAGDSRFYYFKNSCLYRQSRDHSVARASVELGCISAGQIRFSEDRNKLLKVLGNEDDLHIRRLDEPIRIEPGDAFLLCSDGFWEYVRETEMEIDLSKSANPREWLDYMVRRLLRQVTGENDNFTLICVFIAEDN